MTISGKTVSQSSDVLNALGESLRTDFQTLMEDYVNGWLTEDYFIGEDYQEVLNSKKISTQFVKIIEDFLAFEEWLSSGFIPDSFNRSNQQIGKQKISKESAEFYWKTENLEPFESHILDASLPPKPITLSTEETPSQLSSDISETPLTPTEFEELSALSSLTNKPKRSPSNKIEKSQNYGVKGFQELADFINTDLPPKPITLSTEETPSQLSSDIAEKPLTPTEFEELSSIASPTNPSERSPSNEREKLQNYGGKGFQELADFINTDLPPKPITLSTEETPSQLSSDIAEKPLTPTEFEELSSIASLTDPSERSPSNEREKSQNYGVKGFQELADFINTDLPPKPITLSTEETPSQLSSDIAEKPLIPTEFEELSSIAFLTDPSERSPSNEREKLEIFTEDEHNNLNLESKGLSLNRKQFKESQINKFKESKIREDHVTENLDFKYGIKPESHQNDEEQAVTVDEVLEELTKQINQEYRRFYGH